MENLSHAELDAIFGDPVGLVDIEDDKPELLFREVRGHFVPNFDLAPIFDLFPIAGVRNNDGDQTSDTMIFESFDTRRMIEEILDGTHYTHGYKPKNIYNEFGQIVERIEGANGRKLTDEEFDAAIDFQLRIREISVREDRKSVV
jgi:hypothetical protein